MTKIINQPNCGNAPKQQFIRDFYVAIAENELDKAFGMMTDNIIAKIPGYTTASGINAVKNLISKDAGRTKIGELTIENTITHGKYGAINGKMFFEDGEEMEFCSVCAFSSHAKNAKLNSIKVYSIQI